MASLLYGAGLRLRECLKLRVKDVDFEYRRIIVRDGKGQKDRVTMIYTHVMNKGGRGVRSPLDTKTSPRRMEQKTRPLCRRRASRALKTASARTSSRGSISC